MIPAALPQPVTMTDLHRLLSHSHVTDQGVWSRHFESRRVIHVATSRSARRRSRRPFPTLPSRLMSREDTAAYCGCDNLSTFDDWVRRGIIPRPVPGTHRWDRKAIDAALDMAAGLVSQDDDHDPDRVLQNWMDKNAR